MNDKATDQGHTVSFARLSPDEVTVLGPTPECPTFYVPALR